MNKKMFKINERIQFYIHLATLILGGVLIVMLEQSLGNFDSNRIMWIIVMILLLVVVIFLIAYQIYRVVQYRKYFLNDSEVTIWMTIATLVCYPIDIVFYTIILVAII